MLDVYFRKKSTEFQYRFAICNNSIASTRRSPVSHLDRKECAIPMCAETSRRVRLASSHASVNRSEAHRRFPEGGGVRILRDFCISGDLRSS